MGEEDLIKRCEECESCPIEMMLTPAQLRRSVLEKDPPERHIHREVIEQICGKYYDKPCEMKYAIMRLSCDDRIAVQNANIAMFCWDLGKKLKRTIDFQESSDYWRTEQNLGRGEIESYAQRFRVVWDLGLRKNRQTISVMNIYETIIGTNGTYDAGLKHYTNLKKEHLLRDRCALNI